MFFYNCSVFVYSTVAGRKSEINLVVIVIVNKHMWPAPSKWVAYHKNNILTYLYQLNVHKITFKMIYNTCIYRAYS